jgi:WD40-like Beta Propeller Repeat
MVARLICGVVCFSVLLVSGCSGSSDDAAGPRPSTEAKRTAEVAQGEATFAGRLLFSRFDENAHAFKATEPARSSSRGRIRSAWSPDGQRIAFSRTVGGFHADIFTALPDGTDRRQVTATPDNEIRVEWGR